MTLAKPATYAHYGKEQFSLSVDSSINKLIASTPLPNVDRSAFAEACQMSTNARVSIECHWLACTGSHFAGNHHMTG